MTFSYYFTMEDNQKIPQKGQAHQDNDITLEGKRILSTEQETVKSDFPDDTKSEMTKTTPTKFPKSRMQGNQSLVLQMFSHLRVQRKLEEEKNSKIARTDRRRQKIKRELAASCSPDVSSMKTFGSSWTQFRMLRGPQGKLQEAQSDSQTEEGSNSLQSDSNHEPDCQENGRQDLGTGPYVVRFQPIVNNGYVEQLGERKHQRTGAPKPSHHGWHQARPSQQSPQSRWQKNETPVNRCAFDNNNMKNQYVDRGKIVTPNSNTTHVLKGPGKIQIRFSTCSTPASRQRNRGPKHNYQWDSMPAGTLASAQPSLITLDGSIL